MAIVADVVHVLMPPPKCVIVVVAVDVAVSVGGVLTVDMVVAVAAGAADQ